MKNFYILCPANIHTGGPELLHQLCYKLNLIGLNAKMLYVEQNLPDPVHKNYKIYNNDYVFSINDNENNVVVYPEIYINYLNALPKSQKIVWWLSVNNFTNRVLTNVFDENSLMELALNNKICHLVQSYYAKDFVTKLLNNNNSKIYYLSDYLNKSFVEDSIQSSEAKSNTILYNPKKGFEFTKKLIERAPNLNWVPLEGYSPKELATLMQKSKIYIDFGNHPGKDRLPREAAISGCCIITGLRGSAKFYEDIPIPDEFKFIDKDENIDNIINKIKYIFHNYDIESPKFDHYKSVIQKEESNFENDVTNIFKNIF